MTNYEIRSILIESYRWEVFDLINQISVAKTKYKHQAQELLTQLNKLKHLE